MARAAACIMTTYDLATVVLAGPVLGYIDPGSGSLIFQMLVASALAVGIAFRQTREKVTALVRRVFRRDAVGSDAKTKE
jgi:hypothetical protein